MLRDVNDVQAMLDRYFGGAGRRPLSLLRICAWMLVGLVLIGVVAPLPTPGLAVNKYNKQLRRDPLSRVVTLDQNDPRGFLKTRDGNAFTIAWVGPSTLQNLAKTGNGFIPADVRKRLPEIDGRPVHVDIYFMSGARVLDIYAGVQAALHSDADLVVVDMNPLWLFNDRAVQGFENLNGVTFANTFDEPGQWGVAASTYSPSDLALGLAGRWVRAIRDRWSYSAELRRRVAFLNRLDVSKPPPSAAKPSELQIVAEMREPVEFWSRYRRTIPVTASTRARQIEFFKQSDFSGRAFGDLVVDRLLASLAASGKPAYVYMPPLAPDAMLDPSIATRLVGIEQHLAAIASRHPAPLLQVRSESLGRVLPPMPFKDLAHVQDDTPEVTFLSGALCAHLIDVARAERCAPLPPKEIRP